jgi:hypothetical protein
MCFPGTVKVCRPLFPSFSLVLWDTSLILLVQDHFTTVIYLAPWAFSILQGERMPGVEKLRQEERSEQARHND